MEYAMAFATKDSLEENADVKEAKVVTKPNGPVVEATVYNKHCESRLRRELHEYPAYIEVDVEWI